MDPNANPDQGQGQPQNTQPNEQTQTNTPQDPQNQNQGYEEQTQTEPSQQTQTQTQTQTDGSQEPEAGSEGGEAQAPDPQGQEQPQAYQGDIDITQFMDVDDEPIQADDEGFIDPVAYEQRIMQKIDKKMQFQNQERAAWAQVEQKYPDIAKDPDMRDLLQGQRLADVARGGKGDLTQIADRVMSKFGQYRSEGKAQAQVSERVQKSAALQDTSANNVSQDKTADLLSRMSSGDNDASVDLVQQWMNEGKL